MTSNEHPVSIITQDSGSAAELRFGASTITTTRAAAPPLPTLVVVDPHAPVREGLPLLLRSQGIEVLAAAGSGEGGAALIERHEPDVALVAVDLADVDGIVLLGRILERGARTAIVLYAEDENGEQ